MSLGALIVAALVVGAAAWILIRRLGAFWRTGGRSACDNCPYSGNCGGSCKDKTSAGKRPKP